MVKNTPASAGDLGDAGSVPGSEKSLGVRNGKPLQYSCLENSMGKRSLLGYSPWGHKESDMTEHACTCDKTNINMDCSIIIVNFTQNDSYLDP